MVQTKNILVATDFGPASQLAIDHAFALAERLDSKVHVVHVFSLGELPPSSLMASQNLVRQEEELSQRLALFARRPSEGVRLGEVRLVMGDPVPTIAKVAKQLESDLVVVGTHGKGWLDRLFLGSVAEGVVRSAPCPVLVVRTRG